MAVKIGYFMFADLLALGKYAKNIADSTEPFFHFNYDLRDQSGACAVNTFDANLKN